MENLQDQHRMFIQAFMWKKICSSDEVRALYKKCHERNTVLPSELKSFVETINIAIKPMDMELVKGIDEISEVQYYVLINTSNNSISRLSSEYKSNEIELFKKIVNCIIESNDGKVTSTTILNLSDEVQISKREADDIITKFSRDGWLIEDDEGYVFFSTRAIVELQHFFKEHFKEAIILCHLCQKIVFQGHTCNSCGRKFHNFCKNSYCTDTGHRRCPACKKDDTSR